VGGIVSYKIKKTNSSESYQKFSYVMKFEPWDWIIGTGEYVNHISTSVNEMKAISKDNIFDSILLNIATIIIIMFMLIFIVITIAKKTILNPLEDFQHGLLDFFKYLNGEKDNVTLLNSLYKDNAGGIKTEFINKIFEPYFTTKHQSPGIGLGLNIVYKIVNDSMLGNIKVRNSRFTHTNTNQEGAEFTISIPVSL
jgi:hypothetical protein